MKFFASFLNALRTSQQLKADRVIRRYSYLVDQARAHEEKENEMAKRLASAAGSEPSCLGDAIRLSR